MLCWFRLLTCLNRKFLDTCRGCSSSDSNWTLVSILYPSRCSLKFLCSNFVNSQQLKWSLNTLSQVNYHLNSIWYITRRIPQGLSFDKRDQRHLFLSKHTVVLDLFSPGQQICSRFSSDSCKSRAPQLKLFYFRSDREVLS